MGKVLGSWSGMRKYLEQEMLADSLKGRVTYSCTSFPNMDDCKFFEIRIDGKTHKSFSMESVAFSVKSESKQNSWTVYWAEKGLSTNYGRDNFDDEEFCKALKLYRELPIGESIEHPNPLVRMFAVLDRRIGKRTLEKLFETVENQPEWLKELYLLRINAE